MECMKRGVLKKERYLSNFKKMTKLDKNNPIISPWSLNYDDISLFELKEWVEQQIKSGKTKIVFDVGHYHDVDEFVIQAEY